MNDIIFSDPNQASYFCSKYADPTLGQALIGGDHTNLRKWCRDNPDKLRAALDWIHPHHPVLRNIIELEMRDQQHNQESLRHDNIIARLKALENPHWTTTPVFWVTAAGAIAAGLAAWFGWLAIQPPHAASGSKPQNSSQMLPQVAPLSSPTNK